MNGWTKGEVIALFSAIVAVLGVAANNPELRCSLFKDCPVNPPPISSVTGVDYSPLRDLLAAEQWKEADELTLELMLKAAKREQEGYLDWDIWIGISGFFKISGKFLL